MSKGAQTKQRIVAQAAVVFNTQGFHGASIGDLVRAAGIEKGGLYNHFASKEDLALAAFDYAIAQVSERYRVALADKQAARERLLTIVGIFAGYVTDPEPALPGGCPLLNTAIEHDEGDTPLRARARSAMTDWHKLIGSTVKHGVHQGEFQPDVDPREVATIVTSLLEGALMLSRLYDDPVYMQRALAHIERYITQL
ncbi:TetR/AcrR family transcriptional regulator [Candidatus Gracilibacteria bacterium]|nr:TetR/AcrR family transcriptional regulator [Candidatus Gracilibacteria bacterium]